MRSDSPHVSAACAAVLDDLAAVDDDAVLADPARSHVAECLRCQAEVANFRRLRRTMRSLAVTPVPVDPHLEHEILLTLDEFGGPPARRVNGYAAATLGGLAAAAGVIVLATRQRRVGRLVS